MKTEQVKLHQAIAPLCYKKLDGVKTGVGGGEGGEGAYLRGTVSKALFSS